MKVPRGSGSWLGMIGWSIGAGLVVGCAATQTAPAPEPEPPPPAQPEEQPAEQAAEPEPEPEPPPQDEPAEPEFRPGMSVQEAMDAVPRNAERLNMEQSVLSAPLMKPELYEPCNLQSRHHFTARVAVWDGRVVGLDLTTKPQDAALEQCLRTQISAVTWDDKTRSLNTIEYSY